MERDWADRVLTFWFGRRPDEEGYPVAREEWFRKDAAFDQLIRDRFLALWEAMLVEDVDQQMHDARQALALIILLDQFPRNMFRGEKRAFTSDPLALRCSRKAVERAWDRVLHPLERCFVYLPFEHSESLADQDESLRLFSQLESEPQAREALEYARRHHAVIARFGRFPHRNAILGRPSSAEELAFLNTPGSSF